MRNLKGSWENSLREVEMHYVTKTEQLHQILLPLEAELAQIWAEEQCQAQEYEALLNIKVKLESEITTCPTCCKKGRTSVLVMPRTTAPPYNPSKRPSPTGLWTEKWCLRSMTPKLQAAEVGHTLWGGWQEANKKFRDQSWLVWLSGLGIVLCTEGLLV